MKNVISGRKPASLFRFFEEISAIPRKSYHEEQIADYPVSFAKSRGLEYHRDNIRGRTSEIRAQRHPMDYAERDSKL